VAEADSYERALRPLLRQAGGYARGILQSRADAEDAVQQAALKGLERIAQYDDARPFAGWWFAILRNCCIDMLRRRARAATVPLDGHDPPAPDQPEPFDLAQLEAALASLPPTQQEIVRLRYHGGLAYADLAEALAIPRGTVMSRLHNARKALARALGEEIP